MKPFYSVYFNARMCNMRISVNGIPLLSMELDGQCSSRYPFNNLILTSGMTSIRYEARPLHGETRLQQGAYLRCEVELYDMDAENYQPLATMASYESPSHNDVVVPSFVHDDAFQANVPYSIMGWRQSVKLERFADQLRPMVFRKYNSIISMMRNRSFSTYENAFREREDLMGVCFYMSEAEKKERMEAIESIIMNNTEIVPLSSTDELEMTAEGRLVRLLKNDGESALRLRNSLEGEESMIELWLQMKPGCTELTII